MLGTVGSVLGVGWQSGKFLYVDTDLKIDLPQARVVLDRERLADLGFDLAGIGRELGTMLGGAYVNRFNYFDRSYKVIPQLGDKDRATVDPLLDLKIRTPNGQLVPVSTFTHIETSTAPRTLNRFQQRNAVRIFGGLKPGVTKEEGLRVLEGAAASGPPVTLDYAGESRQLRQEGPALTVTLGFAVILIYLVLAAQFKSFRDPLIVLVGSVSLAMSGALAQFFRPYHDQYLFPGRTDHAGRADREERHSYRRVRQSTAGSRLFPGDGGARSLVDQIAAGADDLSRHRLRSPPAGFGKGSRCSGP